MTEAAGWSLFFVGLFVLLCVFVSQQEDSFTPACESRGGHVYEMDADHRVCVKNGEVIHVG